MDSTQNKVIFTIDTGPFAPTASDGHISSTPYQSILYPISVVLFPNTQHWSVHSYYKCSISKLTSHSNASNGQILVFLYIKLIKQNSTTLPVFEALSKLSMRN